MSCPLCDERGSVAWSNVRALTLAHDDAHRLRRVTTDAMQAYVEWLADLMQAGHAESAARVARVAFRLAAALIAEGKQTLT